MANLKSVSIYARQFSTQLTQTMRTLAHDLWSDESAQGATEYILLLAIVVGLAMAFGGKIKGILADKMGAISSAISGFSPEASQ